MPALKFNSKFNPKFNKDKYVRLLKSSGIDVTLTILHQDLRNWEYEAFEGEKGYQPEMIEELNEVREFSRELWQIALDRVEPTTLRS